MKTCAKCKVEKPLLAYSKRTQSKDGLNKWCKICDKQSSNNWKLNNLDKDKELRKIYWKNNLDKMKTNHNNWLKLKSGVYAIFEYGECLYVGESNGLNGRISKHKSWIKNPSIAPKSSKHLYESLQNHPSYVIGVIEECEDHKDKEQHYIQIYQPKYNVKHNMY